MSTRLHNWIAPRGRTACGRKPGGDGNAGFDRAYDDQDDGNSEGKFGCGTFRVQQLSCTGTVVESTVGVERCSGAAFAAFE